MATPTDVCTTIIYSIPPPFDVVTDLHVMDAVPSLPADLLRLLHQVCRHFLAAVFSLKVSRSFDAARLVTMACFVAVADAVMRVVASDQPLVQAPHGVRSRTAAPPISPSPASRARRRPHPIRMPSLGSLHRWPFS